MWCWRRLLRVPWTARRSNQSILKEIRITSFVFIGRTDVEDETPILWLPDAKSWFIWKDPDAEKDWGQEEKGITEDEMAGWHHWLDGRESEWTPGVGDGQEGLTCCDSWGRKELDTTERLNWPDLTWTVNFDKVLLNLLAVSEQFSLTWERSRIQTHVSKSSLFSHQEHHHDTLDITQLLLAFAALAVNSRSKMEALY